jgi:hypothetical protein
MGKPEGYNYKDLIYRVGTFFLLVGIGLLTFFFLSEAARKPEISYFCWSTVLLTLGFLFRAQYKKPVQPSERFSIIKKIFKGKKE